MVPFLVEQMYGWKLRQIKKISIGGVERSFYYLSFPGYIYMLADLFREYDVKENDTLIFTINESNTISYRIYQSNGMEVEYGRRPGKKSEDNAADWIWSFDLSSGKGTCIYR